MKKTLLLLTVLLTSTAYLFAQSWQQVGTVGFSDEAAFDHDMAFDDNDTLYVVYSSNQDMPRVKKFNGTSWDSVGTGVTYSGSGYSRIAFYNNQPYVAIRDNGSPGATYKASVYRYTGSSWTAVGSPYFTTGRADDIDFAIDQNSGTPYIAFKDFTDSSKVSVMKYSGGSWQYVGSRAFSIGASRYPSLVVKNDTPYVAYLENQGVFGYRTSCMKFNGTSWEYVGGQAFSVSSTSRQSLVMNNDTLYLAFRGGNLAKANVLKFDGTNWVSVGPSEEISSTYGGYTSLTVDNDMLYVAYQDGNDGSTVKRYNGSQWETVGDSSFSAGEAIYQNIAVLNGVPYVAYQDRENDDKTSVMKFECSLSNGVTQFGNTLTAAQGGAQATYQWLDCNNANTPVSGATSRSYTPTTDGDYSVLINYGICTDTSECKNSTCNVDTSVTQNGLTLTANADTTASFQWVDCDNSNAPISGETNSSFTATVNGNYAVEVTEDACVSTSSCHAILGVGIKDGLSSTNVHIYPNPATNLLNVEIQGYSSNNLLIELMDFTGKTISVMNSTNGSFDLSELTNGIYIVKLTDANQTVIRKFIKQ